MHILCMAIEAVIDQYKLVKVFFTVVLTKFKKEPDDSAYGLECIQFLVCLV